MIMVEVYNNYYQTNHTVNIQNQTNLPNKRMQEHIRARDKLLYNELSQ